MGCAYSADNIRSTSVPSDDSANEESQQGHQQRGELFLDTGSIEIDMDMTENNGCSTPTKEASDSELAEPKKVIVPPTPQFPSYLLEGRSFLQSPLKKNRGHLLENYPTSSPKRLSRRSNDPELVKALVFRD